ncbi:MAG TPA: metal-dependent transcriptional regulator [Gemmatimonadales bacterium]
MVAAEARSAQLSRSTEDYLKAIYSLATGTEPVQTSAIATALDVAPASVSGMLRRLAEAGLLEHEPYKGVELTPSGRSAALRMVRRHRILESYLMALLGYDWDSVHDEAERLEHAVSDELIERMAQALGNPAYDPHGAPIPSRSGEVEHFDHVPLSDVPVGALVEFRMVSDKDPDRLRYIQSLGMRPGAVLEVIDRQPFRGPVTVRVDRGEPRIIGNELAQSLRCATAKEA